MRDILKRTYYFHIIEHNATKTNFTVAPPSYIRPGPPAPRLGARGAPPGAGHQWPTTLPSLNSYLTLDAEGLHQVLATTLISLHSYLAPSSGGATLAPTQLQLLGLDSVHQSIAALVCCSL